LEIVYPIIVEALKNKESKEVDWKRPVQIISKILGKNYEKAFAEIENQRINNSANYLELKALKLEN
jgi:hypothetical protein